MKILFPVLLFLTIKCTAQNIDKESPIDISYTKCTNKDTSSAGICNCAFKAYADWDRELNKYYNRLKKALHNPKDKAALEKAEAAWLQYRDAEFQSYDYMFNKAGTDWCKTRADSRISVVRDRVMQLKTYYDTITKEHN